MKCKVYIHGILFLEEAEVDFIPNSVVNVYTWDKSITMTLQSCEVRILGKELRIEGYKRYEGSETYGVNTNYSRLILSCEVLGD